MTAPIVTPVTRLTDEPDALASRPRFQPGAAVVGGSIAGRRLRAVVKANYKASLYLILMLYHKPNNSSQGRLVALDHNLAPDCLRAKFVDGDSVSSCVLTYTANNLAVPQLQPPTNYLKNSGMENTRDFQFPPRIKAENSEYAPNYTVSNYA